MSHETQTPETVVEEVAESTALVPVEPAEITIVDQHSNFAVAKARRIMRTSYTGAAKISIDDLDQRQGIRIMEVQGCHIASVEEQVDEKTGEVTHAAFEQVLFKLTDGRVVSAGGKMAEKFAREMIEDLGEYDWPEPILIVIRMHKGKKYEYPNFQVME